MHIPTKDRHIVIEAKQGADGTWVYRAVTPALDWRSAQAEWGRLDETRIGRIGFHSPEPQPRTHFMVRADNDPRWAHLPRPTARRSRERAGKDYGSSVGIIGGKGGWLYDTRRREAEGGRRKGICQGWATYARRASNHLRSIELPDGTKTHWALTAPFEGELEAVSA